MNFCEVNCEKNAGTEKIESDGTDLSITVGGGGDINIGSAIGLTFGNDGEKIEGYGKLIKDYSNAKERTKSGKIIDEFEQSYYIRLIIILTDPVMNKTYEIENMTNDLLRILKNRVPEMNVVGFFIAGAGRTGKVNKRTLSHLLPSDDMNMIMEKIRFLNKNNYLALDQLGYDEYYVLPGGNSLKVENETLDDELIGASKAKLKSAFGKMSKGKVSSRQLLNKFVKLVA